MMLTVKYFAWVREQIGVEEEEVTIPDGVTTVGELMTHLGERGDGYARAFAKPDVIRAAVDQAHAKHTAPVAGAREIAFFPPVTGG